MMSRALNDHRDLVKMIAANRAVLSGINKAWFERIM